MRNYARFPGRDGNTYVLTTASRQRRIAHARVVYADGKRSKASACGIVVADKRPAIRWKRNILVGQAFFPCSICLPYIDLLAVADRVPGGHLHAV